MTGSKWAFNKKGWKLLIASGYRLRQSRLLKILALPRTISLYLHGKFFLKGEEETVFIVTSKDTKYRLSKGRKRISYNYKVKQWL